MSGLSPADAVVALRSFPRRFRAVLERRPDDDEQADHDEVARRVGPDGSSAVDHLVAAGGMLALLDRSLEQVVGVDDPVLPPGAGRFQDATWEDRHRPLGTLLDRFEATALGCADRVEGVPTDEWARRVRLPEVDATIGAVGLVQDAVDLAAGHLRVARRTIDAVR